MADLSQVPTAELLKLLSDDELKQIAGVETQQQPAPEQPAQQQVPYTVQVDNGPSLSNLTNPQNWKDLGSGIVQTLAGLGDMANMVVNPGASIAQAPEQNFSSQGQKLIEALGGDVNTPVAAAGRQIGGAVIPTGGPVATALRTLAAALGGGLGREYGGQYGEIAGSVAPSILESIPALVSKLIGPQTAGGAERVVGDIANKYGITADDISNTLASNSSDPLIASKTSAEVLQSPELATLEQAMGGGSGAKATEYAAAAQARTKTADDLLNALSSARDVPAEFSGHAVQSSYNAAEDASKTQASSLYAKIPKEETPDISSLPQQIDDAVNKYFGEGAPDVPKAIQDRIDYLIKGGKAPTIEGMQKTRSHLGDIARAAERAGNREEAALANNVRDSISKAIENAPNGSEEWKAANAFYRKHAQQFYEGPLKKIGDALPSTVIKKITSSPEAAEQAYKAIGEDPQAITAIKDHIASAIRGMNDAQKVNFISKNDSQLKILLGKDYDILDAIRNDISSRIRTAGLANPTRGSNTALKLSDIVQRAITGKNAAAKPGLWSNLAKFAAGGGAFEAARLHPAIAIPTILGTAGVAALRNRSGGLVRDALYEALMNPSTLQKAAKASEGAGPSQLINALMAGGKAGVISTQGTQ